MKVLRCALAILLASIAISLSAQTAVPPGTASIASEVDPAQGAVWDLTVIYPDDAAAERERVAIAAALPSLEAFRGHLGDNADF